LNDITKLQQRFCTAGIKLNGPMQKELRLLEGLEAKTFRDQIVGWFEQLQGRFWRPLAGASKTLFAASLAQADSATRDVEQQLACGACITASACFLPLAEWGVRAEANDFTLLYRVLERSHGKSVAVADLWRIFSKHAATDGDSSGSSLQKRFSLALVALNFLGYIMPMKGSKPSMADTAYGGRHVRKRHYGRLQRLLEGQATGRDRGSTNLACAEDNPAVVSLAMAVIAEGSGADSTACPSEQRETAALVPGAVHGGSDSASAFGQQRSASQSMPRDPATLTAQKRHFTMSPAHGQKRRAVAPEGRKRLRVFMG